MISALKVNHITLLTLSHLHFQFMKIVMTVTILMKTIIMVGTLKTLTILMKNIMTTILKTIMTTQMNITLIMTGISTLHLLLL
mmetsp:Transcript_10968/g.30795  ORF Transcript_10968/g.30795 Transcript_10968/m.30795 type:complete len:83 (-) Transcript_10968:22-270(-)